MKKLDGRDAAGQAKFVAELFGLLRQLGLARHLFVSNPFSQHNRSVEHKARRRSQCEN